MTTVALVAVLVIVVVGIGLAIAVAAPPDPTGLQQARTELHRIRRRFDVAAHRVQTRTDRDRLKRELQQEVNEAIRNEPRQRP